MDTLEQKFFENSKKSKRKKTRLFEHSCANELINQIDDWKKFLFTEHSFQRSSIEFSKKMMLWCDLYR